MSTITRLEFKNGAKKKIAKKTGRCLQLLQTAVLLLCFFIFIQRIKLL